MARTLDDPMGNMRRYEWRVDALKNRDNLIGPPEKGHPYRSWALIQYEMRRHVCELAYLGGCSGPLDKHHIISRQAMRGALEARQFADELHPEIFLAEICKKHHDKLSGQAHSKSSRAFLMQRKVSLFGRLYVESVLREFGKKFKVPRRDLELDALLSPRD